MSTKASKDEQSIRAGAQPADAEATASAPRTDTRARGSGSGSAGRARRVARSVGTNVRANPFAAVVGAAAVSAGLALLLPATRREAEVMGEVADKLGDAAREIADSAIDAGRSQVESLAQSALAGVGGALVGAVVSGDLSEGGAAKDR